jgi:hypothetical protein
MKILENISQEELLEKTTTIMAIIGIAFIAFTLGSVIIELIFNKPTITFGDWIN